MATSPATVRLEIVSYADPVVVGLRDRLVSELDERYLAARGGEVHPRPKLRPTAEQFDPPDGTFLMAHADGGAVGCGGLRRWGPGIAEVKRMYVEPASRGRGVGRAILMSLEETARQRGYRSIRLETGTPQPEAIALYRSAGYSQIEPYRTEWAGDLSVAFEKHLEPGASTSAGVVVLDARFEDPEAMELCRRLEEDHDQRYGAHEHDKPEPDVDGHHEATSSDFRPPEGTFVVVRLDGRSVGCGGIRGYVGATAEVNRMYVDGSVRRRGLGRRILERLEGFALERGYRSVRLETGIGQPEAISLYRSAGYEPIEPFGRYTGDPFSACFEKALRDGLLAGG